MAIAIPEDPNGNGQDHSIVIRDVDEEVISKNRLALLVVFTSWE
jgi:hypothetical protein